MKLKREDSTRTRERLISAASEVFARKDYSTATIAEICEVAEANVAAVNYHFGDKETLYREAWRYAFRTGIDAHPVNGGVSDDASPEERLRGAIGALLTRITDEKDREFLIVHRELSNPTGLLKEVMENDLVPMHGRLEAIIHELLGPASSPERVSYCAISVSNQCLHPMLKRISSRNIEEAFGPRIDIEEFINHVVAFSLGGIRAIAEGAQNPPRADKINKKPRGKK